VDTSEKLLSLNEKRATFGVALGDLDIYVGLPQKLSKPAQNVDKQPLVVEKRYDI
jgi:hypothetical protein